MNRAISKTLIVLVPLFSAWAIFVPWAFFSAYIVNTIYGEYVTNKVEDGDYIINTLGLTQLLFYVLVLAVSPKEKYWETLTSMTRNRFASACIGFVLFLLFVLVRGFKVSNVLIFYILAIALLALIVVIPIEMCRHASVIDDCRKFGYFKSLLMSVYFFLVIPLIIVTGVLFVMTLAQWM